MHIAMEENELKVPER